jgi:hypothetical protein
MHEIILFFIVLLSIERCTTQALMKKMERKFQSYTTLAILFRVPMMVISVVGDICVRGAHGNTMYGKETTNQEQNLILLVGLSDN